MIDGPRRLFLAIGALAVIWIVTYWLYEPTPPPVTYGNRPAALADRDLRPDPKVRPAAPTPPVTSAMQRPPPSVAPSVPPSATAPGPGVQPQPGHAAPAKPAVVQAPGSPAAAPPSRQVPSRRVREYTVASGDVSWETIAQRVLGDRRRGIDIAKENPLVDPTKLVPGRTVIRIPLDPEPPVVAVPAPPVEPAKPVAAAAPPPARERTYTTESGDTLSGIAEAVYGRSSDWKAIYEANRDKIPNPNRVPVGVTIRIPARGTAGAGG